MDNNNMYFTNYIHQWQKKNIDGNPEELLSFICTLDLSPADRNRLAIAAIAEDFRRQRNSGKLIWVQRQAELFLPCFLENGVTINQQELTCALIVVDLETTQHRLYMDDYIAIFPECRDFIIRLFDRNKTWIESRFRRIDESITQTTEEVHRKSGEILHLSEAYEVLERLGTGGQKDIYQVRQGSTSQLLALKELRNSNSTSRLHRKAMLSEASLQAKLSHPNIPMILSLSGRDDTLPIFVERLITGDNWLAIMDSQSLEENLNILLTVSRTLAYVHEKYRIIHGDLKPENVMLGEMNGKFNEIYLVDWGLAISLDADDLNNVVLGGTIPYMPPESLEASNYFSPATDVFMLGAIAYRILAGKAPYEDDYYADRENAILKVLKADYAPLPENLPHSDAKVPEELREIVCKALSKDPKDRYANGREFADALVRYQKRSGLSERLDAANAALIRYKTSSLTPPVMELIENANELRLIREKALASDTPDPASTRKQESISSLSRRALQMEEQVRNLLLDILISSKDFGLAVAQIPIAREQLKIREQKETDDSIDKQRIILNMFEDRIRRGLAAGRRGRIIKAALIVTVCFMVGLVCLSLYLYSLRMRDRAALAVAETATFLERQEKINAQKEQLTLKRGSLERFITKAASSRLGQGELNFCDQLQRTSPNDLISAARLEECSYRTLLPIKTSSRREIVDIICLAADGKSFLTLSPPGIVQRWDRETLEVTNTIQTPLKSMNVYQTPEQNDNGERNLQSLTLSIAPYLLENPLQPGSFVGFDSSNLMTFLDFDNTDQPCRTVNLNDVNDLRDGTTAPLSYFAFMPVRSDQEPLLLAGNKTGELIFFSFPSGKIVKRISAHQGVIQSIVFDRAGEFFLTCGSDRCVKVWDRNGICVETPAIPFAPKASPEAFGLVRAAFSPSGRKIAAGADSGEIFLWDRDTQSVLECLQEKKFGSLVQRVYWPKESRVISFCMNGRNGTHMLDKREEKGLPLFVPFEVPESVAKMGLRYATLSSDGKEILLSCNSMDLVLLNAEDGKMLAKTEGNVLSGYSYSCQASAYLPGVNRLLTSTLAWEPLLAWNPDTLRVEKSFCPCNQMSLADFVSLKNEITAIAAPDCGTEFLVSLRCGDLCIFDYNETLPKLVIHDYLDLEKGNNSLIVDASPDGTHFLVMNMNGSTIAVHDWKTGKVIDHWNTQLDAYSLRCAFVSNQELCAVSKEENESGDYIQLLKFTVGTPKPKSSQFPMAREASSILANNYDVFSVSNDGKWIALGSTHGKLEIISTSDNGKILTTFFVTSEIPEIKSEIIPSFFSPYQTSLSLTLNDFFAFDPILASLPMVGRDPWSDKLRDIPIAQITWSADDRFLGITDKNGTGYIVEPGGETVCSLAVTHQDYTSGSPGLCLFFTNAGQLISVSSNAVLKSWNFLASSITPETLRSDCKAAKYQRYSQGFYRHSLFYGLRPDQSSDPAQNSNDSLNQVFFAQRTDGTFFEKKGVALCRYSPMSDGTGRFFLYLQNGAFELLDAATFESVNGVIPKVTPWDNETKLCDIAVDAEGRYVAAMTFGDIYYADLTSPDSKWTQAVSENYSGCGNESIKIRCSSEKRPPLLIAVLFDGTLKFWDLIDGREIESPDRLPYNLGFMERWSGETGLVVMSKNERFLLGSGPKGDVVAWDLDAFAPLPLIETPMTYAARDYVWQIRNIVSLDESEEGRSEFVTEAVDGILRFYQYDAEKNVFVMGDALSNAKLSDFFHPNTRYNDKNWLLRIISGFFNMKMSYDYGQDFGEGVNGPQRQLFVPVSSDYLNRTLIYDNEAKILYSNSDGGTMCYDMREIREHEKNLADKWQSTNVEKLTGLRSSEDGTLVPNNHNFMIKIR